MKAEEAIAYWHGIYTLKAIAACFDKKSSFPKSPIEFMRTEKQEEKEDYTLTDEDKMKQVELVFKKFMK